MELKQELAEILLQLYRDASYAFRHTDIYTLAISPIDEMTMEWKNHLSEDDLKAYEEYLSALKNCYFEEGKYLYRKGMQDCFSILKELT